MYRYWAGTQWTDQVNNGAANSTDAMDPGSEQVPPVPGSAAADAEPAAQQPAVTVSQSSGTSFGIILAVVAVVVAIIILLVVIFNNSDNGGGSDPTTPVTTPATTVAPDTTVAG